MLKHGKFSNDEINFLKENYSVLSDDELCTMLNRNLDSIRYKASKLKLKKKTDNEYIEEMKHILLKSNYELLDIKYMGSKHYYNIFCKKHNIIKQATHDCIKQNKFRCNLCVKEKIGKKLRKLYSDIVLEFKSKGLTLITTEDEYKNERQKIFFICSKHPDIIQDTTYTSFRYTIYGCKLCSARATAKQISGELSHLWKGGKRNELKILRDSVEYKNWRKLVFERDNYICQCCNDRPAKNNPVILNAHHIESFAYNEKLRFTINNGITLCDNCHSSKIKGGFHNVYGTHNNTLEQLEEYIQRYKSREFDKLRCL